MPQMTQDEKRALDRDEQELSQSARQPGLAALDDGALDDLIRRLRDRRDRARDVANRQRREARGKARPQGATPAGGNEGTKTKHAYLNAALRRAMAERSKRDAPSQTALAQKAAALRDAAQAPASMAEEGGPLHPRDPDADPGKGAMADQGRRTNQSGAFEHVGEVPSRERSRTRY